MAPWSSEWEGGGGGGWDRGLEAGPGPGPGIGNTVSSRALVIRPIAWAMASWIESPADRGGTGSWSGFWSARRLRRVPGVGRVGLDLRGGNLLFPVPSLGFPHCFVVLFRDIRQRQMLVHIECSWVGVTGYQHDLGRAHSGASQISD